METKHYVLLIACYVYVISIIIFFLILILGTLKLTEESEHTEAVV